MRNRSALTRRAARCSINRPRTSLIDAGTPSKGLLATPIDSPTRWAFPVSSRAFSAWSMRLTISRWTGRWARRWTRFRWARRRTTLRACRNPRASSWSRRLAPLLLPLRPHLRNKPRPRRRVRAQWTPTRTLVVSGGTRRGRGRESSCPSRRRSASTSSVAMRTAG